VVYNLVIGGEHDTKFTLKKYKYLYSMNTYN